jgi:LAO/AO transport system kinase
MGKEYILIETVGVGQDEVDVARTAHTTVVVVIPGMGDDIQAIKAGILEIADIFVINKDDREGADKTFNELQGMVDMAENSGRLGKWRPPIIKAQAIADKGTVELVQAIEKHKEYLAKFEDLSGFSGRRERARKE